MKVEGGQITIGERIFRIGGLNSVTPVGSQQLRQRVDEIRQFLKEKSTKKVQAAKKGVV
jgi:aspartate aminotransferase-like enzyme